MENRFLTLTFFPCCNLPLCSYPQTLRINLFPFFSSCALRRSSPVFPLSYHRTLPRRLPTGISKRPSDCWFRISYDIRKYQFDQISKAYCILAQNTKHHSFRGSCFHQMISTPSDFPSGESPHTQLIVSPVLRFGYGLQSERNTFDNI